MQSKSVFRKFSPKRDTAFVIVLLAIAAIIGVYLIVTTAVISKDSTIFIEFAKNAQTDPVKTMAKQYQHPGYPMMILWMHKIKGLLSKDESLFSWIYAAQAVTLALRLLALTALYFMGKKLVGQKHSFLALLILIALPKPTAYGSDAISDWPHLFFLALGLLLLIQAVENKNRWLFGLTGLIAGTGYLVRPECAQIIVYACAWLGVQTVKPGRTFSFAKTLSAMVLLLAGFLIMAGPYMKLKGAIFPKKEVGRFVSDIEQQGPDISKENKYSAKSTLLETPKAFNKLLERIGDTLMWFFFPAVLIGTYRFCKDRQFGEPGKFFTILLIAVNTLLMIWLYSEHNYISNRHVLPLVIFTIFHIPRGLELMAEWLENALSKKIESIASVRIRAKQWFMILIIAGIAICIPKLLRPLHYDKKLLYQAAQWLTENTTSNDIIAVPDPRIGFYSERKSIEYSEPIVPEEADYIVEVVKKGKQQHVAKNFPEVVRRFSKNDDTGKYKVIIYRRQ